MKAILEFNLPEEDAEHKMALYGADYLFILQDVLQETRKFLKHGHKFNNADEALEYIQQFIYEETSFRNIPTEFP